MSGEFVVISATTAVIEPDAFLGFGVEMEHGKNHPARARSHWQRTSLHSCFPSLDAFAFAFFFRGKSVFVAAAAAEDEFFTLSRSGVEVKLRKVTSAMTGGSRKLAKPRKRSGFLW